MDISKLSMLRKTPKRFPNIPGKAKGFSKRNRKFFGRDIMEFSLKIPNMLGKVLCAFPSHFTSKSMLLSLSKYFSSIYHEALSKPFIFPTFAVTNNVNTDKIFKTDKKSLKKAFTEFSFLCPDKNVRSIIKKAMYLTFSKGGEVSADNYRKNIEIFANILQKYSENELRLGGNAGNASVALACLKNHTYLSGSIRNDYYGKFILNFLKEKGVKTDFLNTHEGKQAVTFCIEAADRGFLCDGADNRYLQMGENFTSSCLKNKFDCLLILGCHVMRHDFDKLLGFVREIKQKTNTILITDAGDFSDFPRNRLENVFELFKMADIACFNETEIACFAETLFDYKLDERKFVDLINAAKIMADETKNVINVHAKNYVFNLFSNKLIPVPTLLAKREKTKIGLGDCFVAGLAFGFLQPGKPMVRLRNSLLIGNACAVSHMETGNYCSLEYAQNRPYICSRGVDDISNLLKLLKYDKKRFLKENVILL